MCLNRCPSPLSFEERRNGGVAITNRGRGVNRIMVKDEPHMHHWTENSLGSREEVGNVGQIGFGRVGLREGLSTR